MIRHWLTRRRLYEYLRHELGPRAEASVASHLARCARCRTEADELRALLGTMSGFEPSDTRPAPYWEAFADGVDRRIDAAPRVQPERVWKFPVPRRREVFAFAGGVAVVLAAFALWRTTWQEPVPAHPAEGRQLATPVRDTTGERVHQYFRRSRVLLVGLANMEPMEEGNLTAERRTSRELIEEARYLQSKPLDARAAKLIDDMETILIELANLEEEQGVSNVDLIRSGIHKENLLFKIRMAEESYTTPNVLPALHTPERN
jgi:hypothetical protein